MDEHHSMCLIVTVINLHNRRRHWVFLWWLYMSAACSRVFGLTVLLPNCDIKHFVTTLSSPSSPSSSSSLWANVTSHPNWWAAVCSLMDRLWWDMMASPAFYGSSTGGTESPSETRIIVTLNLTHVQQPFQSFLWRDISISSLYLLVLLLLLNLEFSRQRGFIYNNEKLNSLCPCQ